jgi:hypothetical protein
MLALLLVSVVIVVIAAVVSALVVIPRQGESTPPSAVIVDQLSLTFPNPTFVEAVTTTLEGAGYVVDYRPGEDATVDLYRDLPKRGYDLIILRVHSALLEKDPTPPPGIPMATAVQGVAALRDSAFLFTSEPYSETRYLEEQMALRVVPVRYYQYQGSADYSRYFGIAADFITSGMRGDLDQATVILMGCDGLTFDRTADAFVRRGAKAVVGWDGNVSASHTDAATERLVQHLVGEGVGIGEAVAETMAEVGPDPSYDSRLGYYPSALSH